MTKKILPYLEKIAQAAGISLARSKETLNLYKLVLAYIEKGIPIEEACKKALEGFKALPENDQNFIKFKNQFLNDADTYVLQLSQTQDPSEALRLLHTLKGNSITLGLKDVADYAAAIEAIISKQPDLWPSFVESSSQTLRLLLNDQEDPAHRSTEIKHDGYFLSAVCNERESFFPINQVLEVLLEPERLEIYDKNLKKNRFGIFSHRFGIVPLLDERKKKQWVVIVCMDGGAHRAVYVSAVHGIIKKSVQKEAR